MVITRAHGLQAPSLDQVWAWLGEIPDPEIPVITIVDLGIVRDVVWSESDPETCVITVTPTYSGCPATEVIARQIKEQLAIFGLQRVVLQMQLSPPWTTDWLTDQGKHALLEYGIAPPLGSPERQNKSLTSEFVVLGRGGADLLLSCPRCRSTHTEMISRFGSTPCKSLHRCIDCREPFDHFKCH